jgi:hypothetical protein
VPPAAGISEGDVLTLRFPSMPAASLSALPPVATKRDVDALFNFSAPPASDYAGTWSADGTAVALQLGDVRNDSAPTLTYRWRGVGDVFYNATDASVSTMPFVTKEAFDAVPPTDVAPRLSGPVAVGDLVRVQGRPSGGVRVVRLNSSTLGVGFVTIVVEGGMALRDPDTLSAPAFADIASVLIEKAYLAGVQLPPYRSPRFLTDVGRLAVSVHYAHTADAGFRLVPRADNASDAQRNAAAGWARPTSVAVLNGSYGVPHYTPPFAGHVVVGSDGTSVSGVNATNGSYYELALTGDGAGGGCVAADAADNDDGVGGGVPGISANDTVDLVFGNRTAAPVSPIGLALSLGIDANGLAVLKRNHAARLQELKGQDQQKLLLRGFAPTAAAAQGDVSPFPLNESVLPPMIDFVETTWHWVNASVVASSSSSSIINTTNINTTNSTDNSAPNATNSTAPLVVTPAHWAPAQTTKRVPGKMAMQTLCRFRIGFSLGDVTVFTSSLNILDGPDAIRGAIEDLVPFGKESVVRAEYVPVGSGGGWTFEMSSSCSFCRGALRAKIYPDFYHEKAAFNVTNVTSQSATFNTTTNHTNTTTNITTATTATTTATTYTTTTTLVTLYNATCPAVTAHLLPSMWGSLSSPHVTLSPDGNTVLGGLVDQLVAFSSPIAPGGTSSLIGTWVSATRLRLRIPDMDASVRRDLTGVGRMDDPVRVGKLSVRVQASATADRALTDGEHFAQRRPAVSHAACVLTGTWGEHPRLVVSSVRASDTNDPPLNGFSNGDSIAVTFSAPTNAPPVATKADIDALFEFGGFLLDKSETNLKFFRCPKQCFYPGKDYVGEWVTRAKLLIRIVDSTLEKKSGQQAVEGETKTIEYEEEAGVTPERQIKIKPQETSLSSAGGGLAEGISGKTAAELFADGLEGGFAMYVRQGAALSTEDESAPLCMDVAKGPGKFCGGLAVGDWGQTANMFSVMVFFYALAFGFFVCALLWVSGKAVWQQLL